MSTRTSLSRLVHGGDSDASPLSAGDRAKRLQRPEQAASAAILDAVCAISGKTNAQIGNFVVDEKRVREMRQGLHLTALQIDRLHPDIQIAYHEACAAEVRAARAPAVVISLHIAKANADAAMGAVSTTYRDAILDDTIDEDEKVAIANKAKSAIACLEVMAQAPISCRRGAQ